MTKSDTMTNLNMILFFFIIANQACTQEKPLSKHILFYSSFDGTTKADISVGDADLFSADSYKLTDQAQSGLHTQDVVILKNAGHVGDALHFKKPNTKAIYYNGHKNLGYSPLSWSGSFSFWLKVDPEKELAPGYCDPIILTDKKFNDAALWVDFTDDEPRAFRLGVLGDLDVWNPDNNAGKEEMERRIVTVKQPSFGSDQWTHIVISYSEINTNNSISKLYINGQLQGAVQGVNDPFSWKEERAKIMLGLGYVGLMDELAAFDKALDEAEVQTVYQLEDGIKSLFN